MSVDHAHHEIFRAKDGKGGINLMNASYMRGYDNQPLLFFVCPDGQITTVQDYYYEKTLDFSRINSSIRICVNQPELLLNRKILKWFYIIMNNKC